MNIQLFIEGRIVDLAEDTSISLEKSFENQDNVVEEVNYSFDIELPITSNNRQVFGYTDVFDVPNKFGRIFNAILNADEVTIINGKFILNNIDSEFYSGQLYVPSTESLSDVLGDKKMNEIISHPKTIATWDNIRRINNYVGNLSTNIDDLPPLEERDNHICFPYILYRLPWNTTASTYDNYTQDMSSSGSTFSLDTMFPAYNVLSIIKDVFQSEGYTVTGDIFNNDKFTNLWQTFSCEYDKWKDNKSVPYYLQFGCDYRMRVNNNTSPTLTQTNVIGSNFIVGTDAPLVAGSANTKVYNEIDEFGMLTSSSDGNGHVITVPQSGWYKIRCVGTIHYPQQYGYFIQADRTNTTGLHSDSDWTDFHNSIAEFQIKKTSTPLSNTQIYGNNLTLPCVPYEYDEDRDIEGFHQILSSDKPNYIGKNGKTSLVKDYSGFDISDFIACASFGSQFQTNKKASSRYGNRLHFKAALSNLPNPSNTTSVEKRGDDEIPCLHLYNNDDWNDRYDYGKNRAQVFVRDDSYSNFEGYNLLRLSDDETTVEYDTTSNFNAMSWQGAENSNASTSSLLGAKDCTWGNFHINTCVWLEEGDGISIELISPYHDWRDKCSWIQVCDWKNRKRSGITLMDATFSFQMGIVTTDKDWIPTQESPIKTFDDIKIPKQTNMNQFLSDTKVNDWINNFLKTFNLKLTKLGGNAYSIDTQVADSKTFGEIIDVDKYANVKDATFSRIDLPSSVKFGWTIDTDEEGYVHGNNAVSPQEGRDIENYDGSLTVIYDATSNAKSESTKSNWSYNWYKTITFRNYLNLSTNVIQKKIPVITDADLWSNTFYTIQDEPYQTEKKERFFYLKKTKFGTCENMPLMVMEEINNNGTITREGTVKANFLFPTDHLEVTNSNGKTSTFYLDYNKINQEQTITTTFFEMQKIGTYEIDIPVTLPNYIYSKIRANTIIKFNDGLYKIYGIEGHDVACKEEATLKLIPLY